MDRGAERQGNSIERKITMEKPLMTRFDVTVSPSDDFLEQATFEVDAVGEEEAMEFVRSLSRGRVTVRAITAHREPRVKPKPITILVRLRGCMNMRRRAR